MSRFLTLNIGASRAVLAEYALKGKSTLTLTAYGEADLSAAGEAVGSLEATLTPSLHRIMREKGIKPAPLVVSLNGQSVFPRFAKFPAVAPEKLEELVRYEVEQNVPFPIDEIVCDHQFTGTTPEGEKAAMIVAAKLDQVRAVTDAVASAGLSPQIVDVSPMAIYNAFRWSNPGATGCSVILDIGSRTTSLILVEAEKIYTRSIPTAGNTITKDIAQTFGCSLEEAEQLKLERGYVSLGGVTEDEDEITDRVSKVIRTVLTRLHAEISRSINFYRSQQGGNAPSRLFLTGGTVRLPQLDDFFRETLQVEVSYLNPFSHIALGPKINRNALANDAFTLAESAGLALRMTDAAAMHINLMPPELIEHARAVKRIPFLVVGALGFLAALGVGIYTEKAKGESARAQVENVQRINGRLKQLDTKLKAAQRGVLEEQERCDEFQHLLLSRSVVLRCVNAVRESLIPGMWITAWEPIKVKTGETESDGLRVTIRGWRDTMGAAEAMVKKDGGRKITAAEMVQGSLKGRGLFVPDSVKIVAQRDVKDCLFEFAISMVYAPPPSILADGKAEGAGKKKKGAR
ncbi:MAG: type IV pilus assembly protein PilM [Kiritimatiellae bacterium]|nr:type IV pilus assembly protein PilM [Kiritimatiellia bacterium]